MKNNNMLRPPEEQEVFQRVWQRVMAGRSEAASPIETTPAPRQVDGDVSSQYLAPMSRPAPRPIRSMDQPVSDLPVMGLELPAQSETTARLRQQTLEALEGWQFYRHLARRTRGSTARVLAALASDQHQLARKLAAAYFLHSGVRYWPSEQLSTPAISSFWGALRQRHQAEQQAELSYRMSADEGCDAALTELYQALMDACRSHCRQLRGLLEQSCP